MKIQTTVDVSLNLEEAGACRLIVNTLREIQNRGLEDYFTDFMQSKVKHCYGDNRIDLIGDSIDYIGYTIEFLETLASCVAEDNKSKEVE